MQCHGEVLRISEWVNVINASLLADNGIIETLAKTGTAETFEIKNERGLLLLAGMTTKDTLAAGSYAGSCIECPREA